MLHWQTKLVIVGLFALGIAALVGKGGPHDIGFFW